MTLALILVVIDAVDINDAFVVVIRVNVVDLDQARVSTSLNLLLAVGPLPQDHLLLASTADLLALVLRALVSLDRIRRW